MLQRLYAAQVTRRGGTARATAIEPAGDVGDVDDVTDALLSASRALVAVAARSIAAFADDVTLPQYRALVVLASRGPQSMGSLAAELGVHPSTATRLGDRLVVRRLARRTSAPDNRREVRLSLTTRGRRLVDDVTGKRRAELARVVARIPPNARRTTIDAMRTFADAAGEIPDPAWSIGADVR
jgi:DNA-binding MarR family transcriptional regulator